MEIELHNVGKRYRYEWIFRQINYTFSQGQSYAILGHNGSGKSTFLRILSAYLTPSKGQLIYKSANKKIPKDQVYRSISYAAPYIDLIEELTLQESIEFHQRFKPFKKGVSKEDVLELLELPGAKNKALRYFSSGMKQRLKLALSICSDTPILLLDEPTTNLDQQGIDWYQRLIKNYTPEKLLIIASNVKADYQFCQHQIDITNFKKKKS